jgi:hypothetical protein
VAGIGQVLDQGAAEGDVEQLDPPADPQQGDLQPDRRPGQGQLQLVAAGVGPVLGRVVGGPVVGRLDVPAAGQQQAVEGGQELLGVAGLAWRQQRHPGPGRPEGGDVRLGEGVGTFPVPNPPGSQMVGGDRDQWRRHRRDELSPRVSAASAPRWPSGRSGPVVVSLAVWRSISASNSAPRSTAKAER